MSVKPGVGNYKRSGPQPAKRLFRQASNDGGVEGKFGAL
jgi:hypothetical protein